MTSVANKYRNGWMKYITVIPDMLTNKSKLNEQFVVDCIKDFIILTQLANKEIDVDDTENKKCLAKANLGLDLADMILHSLIENAINHHIGNDKFTELYNFMRNVNTNFINPNDTMLSESYIKMMNGDDLESYYL